MAQLKNTVVQGSLKATDTIYSSTGQFQIIKAPTTSGGSTYGPGTNGQVLKSNGSSVYWATDNNNTYYAPTTAGTAGQFLKAVGGTSAPTWNNIYYSDIKPAIKKTYASTSYYATAANDNAKSAFYFMNIRPNDWNKPWTVKFKIHSFCPNYSAYQSTTECTLSGRQQDIIYHNWNEQINTAHVYISMLRLKSAGYNAGLGHAVGINILNGGNYTNSNYYRTFEVEYYECDACEVTLLDAPVLQANWSNYNTTNYNTVSNYDASNRGLKESGDDNDTFTSMINIPRIVTGSSVGIGRYTLFMEAADGTYQSITSTFNSTGTSHVKNSALFRPERIFYSNRSSDLAANNSTNTDNGWMHQQTSLIDLRYSTNCGKTLVGRKPVYLVGTIDANGFFSLANTWWTQTEPTEEDGYVYIYLGRAYTQDESNNLNTQYRVAFELDNPIYWYKNGQFVLYESPYLFSTSLTNTDLNTLNSANVHQRRFYSYFGAGSNGCTNLPIGDGQAFGLLSYPTASGLLTQELSSNAVTPGKWLRWYSATAGAWTDWQKIITSSGGTISGDLTLTGTLKLANNTWNLIGDDVYLGDINKGGHLGIQGKNENTGLFFVTYNQTSKSVGGAITWDGTKFSITSTTPVAADISGSAKYLTNLGRLTSANLDSSSAEYLNKAFVFYASGSMTEGKPDKDSVIFHCSWDNSTWASQLALPINRATDRSVQWRGSDNNAWGDWRTLLDSNNYTDYTVTKTGTGASGTWSITADKATKDADGLNISTNYLKLSGGTMTGLLTLKTNLVFKCDDVTINTSTNNGNTGSSPIFRGINANDSTNTWYGQWHTAVNPDGTLNVYLNARNKKTDGTEVINSLIVGVKKDGTRYYQVSDAAAFRSALGLGSNATSSTAYLPLTGGTITGDLVCKSSIVDASKTNNNITGSTYLSLFTTRDSESRALGRIESIIQDNGNIGLYLYVKNYDTSGAQVQPKGILMTMNKSGALTYTIADVANFATALTPHIYYVHQSSSSTANWRKIVLGYQSAAAPSTAVEAVSNQVYVTASIEAQTSTGTLRATNYRVANNVELQWNSTDSSLDFVFI